jgi:CPA1 family monovalent cation:H+ antiporter
MSIFELVGLLATAVAVFGYLNHRYVRLPDALGITAMGLLATLLLDLVGSRVPALAQWASEIVARVDFTELVFHGFLGVLLFAGGLHINFSELERQKYPVLVLATVGVLISTAAVGVGAWALLAMAGVPVSLAWCLVFGALISPTDPIAVLAILKTVGAPKALEMDIAGESLFNDGTAVVAFLVLLGIATGSSQPSAASIVGILALEVLGALAVGLVVGYVAFFMLKGMDSYPVEIIITLALATGGYALAERLHVSAPLAVVVMGLVIGNHGAKSAMGERTRQNLFSFWELIDEVLNLLLFGLIGLSLLGLQDVQGSWWLAAALVPIVLAARFASVGLPAILLRRWFRRRTPHAVKVLTWGGVRGGISVALALSLPAFEGRELFVMGTFCVVLFSLLVQGPTVGLLLRRLGLARERER